MKILNFTFGFLLAVTSFSCTDDYEEVPTDKYTGKFPNAKNKNFFMPLALNNFWIYKTLNTGMDTIRLRKSSAKNFRFFTNTSFITSFTSTVEIFAENDSTFWGYFASDSGVIQCIGFNGTGSNLRTVAAVKADSIFIYRKEAPSVPVKNTSEEVIRNINQSVYKVKSTTTHFDLVTVNGEKITDVWEFKTVSVDTIRKNYSYRTVSYFKKGVGLLDYEYVEILNDFEVLSDKKVLIDYGLN